jgi:hypothetical protein
MLIEVSIGEVVDKVSILEIKSEKIKTPINWQILIGNTRFLGKI